MVKITALLALLLLAAAIHATELPCEQLLEKIVDKKSSNFIMLPTMATEKNIFASEANETRAFMLKLYEENRDGKLTTLAILAHLKDPDGQIFTHAINSWFHNTMKVAQESEIDGLVENWREIPSEIKKVWVDSIRDELNRIGIASFTSEKLAKDPSQYLIATRFYKSQNMSLETGFYFSTFWNMLTADEQSVFLYHYLNDDIEQVFESARMILSEDVKKILALNEYAFDKVTINNRELTVHWRLKQIVDRYKKPLTLLNRWEYESFTSKLYYLGSDNRILLTYNDLYYLKESLYPWLLTIKKNRPSEESDVYPFILLLGYVDHHFTKKELQTIFGQENLNGYLERITRQLQNAKERVIRLSKNL